MLTDERSNGCGAGCCEDLGVGAIFLSMWRMGEWCRRVKRYGLEELVMKWCPLLLWLYKKSLMGVGGQYRRILLYNFPQRPVSEISPLVPLTSAQWAGSQSTPRRSWCYVNAASFPLSCGRAPSLSCFLGRAHSDLLHFPLDLRIAFVLLHQKIDLGLHLNLITPSSPLIGVSIAQFKVVDILCFSYLLWNSHSHLPSFNHDSVE